MRAEILEMKKTFTYLLILFVLGVVTPCRAAYTFETSSFETKYGERDLVNIYPNPMVNDASIKISEEVDLEKSKVVVVFYNMVGSEVYHTSPFKEDVEKITREMFRNAGIYFYQLKVDDKVVSTGRITIK